MPPIIKLARGIGEKNTMKRKDVFSRLRLKEKKGSLMIQTFSTLEIP
jgi:hypothetical protein